MLSDRFCLFCLSVLSVTLVYCGQTIGWIKMKFGMEVGFGLRDIVLDGPRPHKKAQQPPLYVPCLLWPKSWMDPDIINLVRR